jgi:hypothetical protein
VNGGELQPFRQRTLLALIGLGAAAFLAMAYFMITTDSQRWKRVASPSTTSKSAIGYRAFVELLGRFDLPLASPTHDALNRQSLRIVLAPKDAKEVLSDVVFAQSTQRPVLIVLPKWRAHARFFSDHVTGATLLESEKVKAMADPIASDIEVVRPKTLGPWRNEVLQGEPTLSQPQLVRSDKLCPLVSNGEGILIGRVCKQPSVVVLSDPELLANNGLWRGDNAVLAMSAVSLLRVGKGPIVVLDVSANAAPARSIWRLAISPPFALITLASLIAAGIAVWRAATRFGPPLAQEPAPSGGVLTLIDITARLLRPKADGGRLLRRYADLVTLDLGRRLRAPQRLQGAAEIGAWLDQSRRGAKAGLSYGGIASSVEAIERDDKTAVAGVISAATQLHRWREELLDGR